MVERQEWQHVLAHFGVRDDLVDLREDLLHRLQQDALPCHFLRLLVFLIDGNEAVGASTGEVDDLLGIGFRLIDYLHRFSTRSRDEVVAVAISLLDHFLLVLAGAHDILERTPDLFWWMHVLKLDVLDADSRAITVERFLQKLSGGGFNQPLGGVGARPVGGVGAPIRPVGFRHGKRVKKK